MEKITWEQVQKTPEFLKGRQEFLEGVVKKSEEVKYNWYRKIVSGTEWNRNYKALGYTILNMSFDGKVLKEVEFAFIAVIPPEGCLEIIDIDELMKIQRHRELSNTHPTPFEKIK